MESQKFLFVFVILCGIYFFVATQFRLNLILVNYINGFLTRIFPQQGQGGQQQGYVDNFTVGCFMVGVLLVLSWPIYTYFLKTTTTPQTTPPIITFAPIVFPPPIEDSITEPAPVPVPAPAPAPAPNPAPVPAPGPVPAPAQSTPTTFICKTLVQQGSRNVSRPNAGQSAGYIVNSLYPEQGGLVRGMANDYYTGCVRQLNNNNNNEVQMPSCPVDVLQTAGRNCPLDLQLPCAQCGRIDQKGPLSCNSQCVPIKTGNAPNPPKRPDPITNSATFLRETTCYVGNNPCNIGPDGQGNEYVSRCCIQRCCPGNFKV